MAEATPAEGVSPVYRGVVLAMLVLVFTFNFADRQLLSILAPAIQKDLAISDSGMGLLGGFAFAFLYSTLAIPLSWLADRTSRTWVITVSLALWSAFTIGCGIASGFGQLFLCRLGVGIGEAGGVAPSYATVADYFPPRSRARATALYSLGIPLGSAAGVIAGGYILKHVDWRTAFLVVGASGLIFAPFFRLIVREPARERTGQSAPQPIGEVFAILARKPSFWLLAFGAASNSMIGYGVAFWLPSLMIRSFHLEPVQTSLFYGMILLVSGVLGTLAGGWLGDWLGKADRGAHARVAAVALALAGPLYAAGVLSPTITIAALFFIVPTALGYVWISPVLTAVQHLVPGGMRATASASFLLINNLLGLGGGIYFLGRLSDALKPGFGDEALRWAMLFGLSLYLVAALLMWLAAKPLRKDWVD